MAIHITTDVAIRGMLSVHSVRAVFTALAGVEGIMSADVSLGRAVIEHDGTATHEHIAEAIALAGCEVVALHDEKRLPVV
ncbi:MAG TPA: cation transporter [Gemmatimonadaceae bacterium]